MPGPPAVALCSSSPALLNMPSCLGANRQQLLGQGGDAGLVCCYLMLGVDGCWWVSHGCEVLHRTILCLLPAVSVALHVLHCGSSMGLVGCVGYSCPAPAHVMPLSMWIVICTSICEGPLVKNRVCVETSALHMVAGLFTHHLDLLQGHVQLACGRVHLLPNRFLSAVPRFRGCVGAIGWLPATVIHTMSPCIPAVASGAMGCSWCAAVHWACDT
jgi:hypothetical protein